MERCNECFRIDENTRQFQRLKTCELIIEKFYETEKNWLLSSKEKQLMIAVFNRFFKLKNQDLRETTLENVESNWDKVEYIYECLQTITEVLGVTYNDGHPFLIGGIPLSESLRKRFKGVFYDEEVFEPIFEDEDIRPNQNFLIPNYYLTRETPCGCGTTKVNLANSYFKNHKTWPF